MQPVILGFDPGRDKCGVAVVGIDRTLYLHSVVESSQAILKVQELRQQFPLSLIVMGNQTTAQAWKQKLAVALDGSLRIVLVDERYSTLEARDRYWQLFPPQGLAKLIPQSLRPISRPVDDIVAILLVERYLNSLTAQDQPAS